MIPAGFSLVSSAAERFNRTALNLVLNGCTVDANGIDFSTSATNDARIAAANNTPLRLTSGFAIHVDFTTGSTVANQGIIEFGSGTGFAGYNLFLTSGGVLELMLGCGAANINSDNRRSWTFGTLAINQRYRVSINITSAALTSGTAGVTGWVNGVAVTPGTSGSGGAMAYGANDFVLGNRTPYGTARNGSQRLHKLAIEDVNIDATDAAAWVSNADTYMDAANSNISLTSVPTNITRGTAFNVVVSGAAVAPTTGNTTVRLNGASGPACTVNSVSGSGPWTINCTAAAGIAIQHNAVGYPLHLTIGAETLQSAAIPFNPATGYSFVNLTSINSSGNSLPADYTYATAAVGGQFVYQTSSSPSALSIAVSAAGIASYSGTLTQNNSFNYYYIAANGAVGASDSLTFTYNSMSVTSVNAGSPIPRGAGDIPIVLSSNGLNVTGVSLNGVAQSFEIVSATLIYLTNSAWPNCMYGQTITLTVTATGGVNASANTSLRAAATNGYTTADGTYNANNVGTILGTPAIVSGDQLEFEYPSSNGAQFTMPPSLRPENLGTNPGFIRCRILDNADKTFGNWFDWVINPESGSVATPSITGVTNARMGQTITVNCNTAVNMSTSSGLGISVGGVALTNVQATGPSTLTGLMPLQGIQLGANRPVTVSANGVTSTPFNTTVQSVLGQVVTLSVPYNQLHPDSPLRDPALIAVFGNLIAGDQVEYATPSVPGNYVVSVSSTGVVTITGASNDPVAQNVQYTLIRSSTGYSRSPVGTWAIASNAITRLTLPNTIVQVTSAGAYQAVTNQTLTFNIHEFDSVNNRIGNFIHSMSVLVNSGTPTRLDSANNGPTGTLRAVSYFANANGFRTFSTIVLATEVAT